MVWSKKGFWDEFKKVCSLLGLSKLLNDNILSLVKKNKSNDVVLFKGCLWSQKVAKVISLSDDHKSS